MCLIGFLNLQHSAPSPYPFRYVCKTGCLMRAYLMPFLSFSTNTTKWCNILVWGMVCGVWGYLLYTSFGLQLQHHRDNHFSFPLCKINVFILVRFNAVYVSGACELFSLHRLCCAATRSSYSIQTYIWVTFKLPNAISCKNAAIYAGLMAEMPKIQWLLT